MRKIEFKAKSNYKQEWTFGSLLHLYEDFFEIIAMNEGHGLRINPSTLCQLITEIDGVKIFEYDCWLLNDKMYYYYYKNNGLLYYTILEINLKSNVITNIIENHYIDYRNENNNAVDVAKFIGNWHDGEQYLLDKIKELEK